MNQINKMKTQIGIMDTETCNRRDRITSTRGLTTMAMLAAVAVILMFLELPLWFAPEFYKLDFSEVPVMIGAYALGPVGGIVTELVKILLKSIIQGSRTAFLGEFANFLIGCALVVPSAVIYHWRKTKKSVIVGLILGVVCMTTIGSLLNAYLLLPLYANMTPLDKLIAMGTKVNPNINSIQTMVLYAVVPFNLLKGTLVSVLTMLLYKKVNCVIKSFN